MNNLLFWLQGKKGSIASILMGIIAYFGTIGVLGSAEVTLAALICTVLFGTASYQTKKLYESKE